MTRAAELYGRPWIEKEYLIVLDEYFRTAGQPRHIYSDYVADLSKLLGRTPASICMRMGNFASVDPEASASRRGLSNVGPMCKKVIDEWSNQREALHLCAQVLRREIEPPRLPLFEPGAVRIPRAFQRYELLDHLGDGGFGHVFSCIDAEGQLYAIKIIHAQRVHDREVLHRFHREMRALKKIRHPNVIRLHEDNIETEADFPAFIMDLAECTLNEYIAAKVVSQDGESRCNLPFAEAAEIFRAVLDAAIALHSYEPAIAHRDINPTNILRLQTGAWVLADFSLAKFMTPIGVTSTFATQTKASWGTGLYAAPEQYRDFKTSDSRSDIYALGILMWDLFSQGWPPFERDHPQLPPPLVPIFRRCTERTPGARYETVAQMKLDFDAAAAALIATRGLAEAP